MERGDRKVTGSGAGGQEQGRRGGGGMTLGECGGKGTEREKREWSVLCMILLMRWTDGSYTKDSGGNGSGNEVSCRPWTGEVRGGWGVGLGGGGAGEGGGECWEGGAGNMVTVLYVIAEEMMRR